jgi:aminotransferase
MVTGLREIEGIECEIPKGAFYVFPKVASFGISSVDLADRILDEVGVALLPGSSFGQAGEGYLRISYAISRERLQEGLDRLKTFFEML